jgi:AraC-like DNA-binding protein
MELPLLEELRDLIARHGEAAAAPHAALPNLMLLASRAPILPTTYVIGSQLALVAQGDKEIRLGRKVYGYGSGQYMIVTVDLPLLGRIVGGGGATFLGLCMTLRPDLIAELLLEAGGMPPTIPIGEPITISSITNELLDPLVRYLRLLDRPRDLPILSAGIEREIVWRLMSGPQGPLICQIGLADSRTARIGRAIHVIREHYMGDICIRDLARIASMSATTFHRTFRGITALSPIQYQKQLRLQAARSKLLAGAQNVTEVGFAVGFNSPSQFSRDYRRLFGRPPSRDVQ